MKKSKPELRDTIVDTAVVIAECSSWEAVRLFDVATQLNISLDDIRLYFREKEDLVDAWFDRADGQMLKASETVAFLSLSPRDRLQHLIMTWLDALVTHRKVTRQMIGAKLEPGHLHIQIPAIMRISRTVQWMREAAQREATFVRRALEETALTTIYLATFTYWMQDTSENSQRTRDFLEHKLLLAESLDHTIYGAPRNEATVDSAEQSEPAPEIFTKTESSPLTEPIAPRMHAKSG
ncbi:TetR/AcrR family transcriptional regulator [uncultured Nitrosomonas sp.]|uniref:TetR/AcrR family transcriptional regulator n=1 Tax=uncultured Nitrosomonas sp. TaxID=156424 RepID=UPI0025D85640|nr:TetR/AcrR family transcriptional regulator [uncultured Nitrosomonas sp.]